MTVDSSRGEPEASKCSGSPEPGEYAKLDEALRARLREDAIARTMRRLASEALNKTR